MTHLVAEFSNSMALCRHGIAEFHNQMLSVSPLIFPWVSVFAFLRAISDS